MLNTSDVISLAGSTGLTFAVTQATSLWVKDIRWLPVISVVSATALNLLSAWGLSQEPVTRQVFVLSFFSGLITGLAAAGLYSIGITYRVGAFVNRVLHRG